MGRTRHEPIQKLSLTTRTGKPLQLTASQLEKWFVRAESSLHTASHKMPQKHHQTTPRMLAYFGLQSSTDVIRYLNSPEGKITLALIAQEMAENEALIEAQREQYLAHLRHKRYALAFLLLGLMHRRAARHHHEDEELRLEMEAQQKERQAQNAPQSKQELNLYLEALNEASKAITDLLSQKLQDAELLEKSAQDLEKLIEESDKNYENFTIYLDKAYQQIQQWTHEVTLPIEEIQRTIDALKEKIDVDSETIGNLIAQNREVEAQDMLRISQAQNLQVSVLEDTLAVHHGTKILLNAEGETLTDGRPIAFHEATFVIPKTMAESKRIVLKDGNYYLVQANCSFDGLSEDEKEEGKKAYARLRPEILGTKHLIEHNRKLEKAHHQEQKSRLCEHCDLMQQDIAILASQLTKIQVEVSEVELLLKPEPSKHPKMTPMPAPTKTPSKLSQNSYHHMIQLMHFSPTKSSLQWLEGSVANASDAELKQKVARLEPGKPIPDVLMKSLVQRRDLGNVWLNPATPDFIKSRLAPKLKQKLDERELVPRPNMTI